MKQGFSYRPYIYMDVYFLSSRTKKNYVISLITKYLTHFKKKNDREGVKAGESTKRQSIFTVILRKSNT